MAGAFYAFTLYSKRSSDNSGYSQSGGAFDDPIRGSGQSSTSFNSKLKSQDNPLTKSPKNAPPKYGDTAHNAL